MTDKEAYDIAKEIRRGLTDDDTHTSLKEAIPSMTDIQIFLLWKIANGGSVGSHDWPEKRWADIRFLHSLTAMRIVNISNTYPKVLMDVFMNVVDAAIEEFEAEDA